MSVETAMRQTRRLHEVSDPDPFEAPLTEQLGCSLDDPFPILYAQAGKEREFAVQEIALACRFRHDAAALDFLQ